MEKLRQKKEKNKILYLFLIIFIFLMCITISKNFKLLKFNYQRYSKIKPEFSFSIFNKTINNDTFFTIAIGQYRLENENDNMDHLTWHENLEFPHSRSI